MNKLSKLIAFTQLYQLRSLPAVKQYKFIRRCYLTSQLDCPGTTELNLVGLYIITSPIQQPPVLSYA